MRLITARGIWTASIFAAILAVGLVAYVVHRVVVLVELGPVGIHQRSVTLHLSDWENEYGRVRNWSEVDRAIGMLEYVQHYYVPASGYHSDPHTEAALEAQRARTVAAIEAGLKNYTGRDFGTDAARWREWMQKGSVQGEAK